MRGLHCSYRLHSWLSKNRGENRFPEVFSGLMLYATAYCPESTAYLVEDGRVKATYLIEWPKDEQLEVTTKSNART